MKKKYFYLMVFILTGTVSLGQNNVKSIGGKPSENKLLRLIYLH